MTEQRSGASSKDRGYIWVIIPFVLAVIGTVVMLFTNSANALKVALIFALWAGAAGIIVVDRARRDRDVARATAEEREHELAATRAQFEQGGAAQQGAGLNERDLDVLRELQDEIKSLRSQLEEMRGAAFEYEPAAVQASARRIPELGLRTEPEDTPSAEEEAPLFAEPVAEQSSAPRSEYLSDDTLEVDIVREPFSPQDGRPAGAPSADAIAGRLGQQPARDQPNPLVEIINQRTNEAEQQYEPEPEPEPEQMPWWRPVDPPEPEPEPAPEPEPEPAPEPVRVEEPLVRNRGGRRRRDEQGSGAVSVADLLARRESESF